MNKEDFEKCLNGQINLKTIEECLNWLKFVGVMNPTGENILKSCIYWLNQFDKIDNDINQTQAANNRELTIEELSKTMKLMDELDKKLKDTSLSKLKYVHVSSLIFKSLIVVEETLVLTEKHFKLLLDNNLIEKRLENYYFCNVQIQFEKNLESNYKFIGGKKND